MNVDLAILQLGKNNNQYKLNDAKTGIQEWRGSDPEPTTSELTAAWDTYKANADAVAYKDKRAAEYPSVVDQLDDIYHNGIDAWKATIKTTKDKYPK
jgi:hypothetical protein